MPPVTPRAIFILPFQQRLKALKDSMLSARLKACPDTRRHDTKLHNRKLHDSKVRSEVRSTGEGIASYEYRSFSERVLRESCAPARLTYDLGVVTEGLIQSFGSLLSGAASFWNLPLHLAGADLILCNAAWL